MNYKEPTVIALRKSNPRFDQLCRKHEKYEAEIEILTKRAGTSHDEALTLQKLKKEKLAVKEQLNHLIEHS